MQKARYVFVQTVKDWTLEDWKQVIWTDETSIILGHRRGGVRVWRTAEEQYEQTCTRRRWHGASEFMFWGGITYDRKGPYHIWEPEDTKSKKEAIAYMKKVNNENEAAAQEEWELATAMQRLDINRAGKPPGKALQWRFNAKTGAVTQKSGKGGIGWWRYQREILIKKLLYYTVTKQKIPLAAENTVT